MSSFSFLHVYELVFPIVGRNYIQAIAPHIKMYCGNNVYSRKLKQNGGSEVFGNPTSAKWQYSAFAQVGEMTCTTINGQPTHRQFHCSETIPLTLAIIDAKRIGMLANVLSVRNGRPFLPKRSQSLTETTYDPDSDPPAV